MQTGVEQHVDWIATCMEYMRERALEFVEANEDAEDQWVAHSTEVANATLYPQTNSWYVGANIPGKPRRFSVYLGGFSSYREHCDLIAERGYQGFAFEPSARAAEERVAAL
jgi:cyclohexanone monooxygenase